MKYTKKNVLSDVENEPHLSLEYPYYPHPTFKLLASNANSQKS